MGFFEDLIKKADELRRQRNPFYDEDFIKGANKNINDFLGTAGDYARNPAFALTRDMARNTAQSADVSRPLPKGAGLDASAKDHSFRDSFGFAGKGVGNLPTQEEDPMKDLWNLLNEKYSGSPVDTSFLQQALDAQTGAIDGARNQAQENFRTSDSNLAGMHDAFRNDILAQAPKIQEQNQKYQTDLSGIFDKTLQENAQRQALNKSQDAEMLARLGIAPAANQPDLVGQEIENGNQRAVGSRDARLAEAATIGNSEIERNTSAANAVGAAGVERRSDLNMRLQDILGQLSGKEADVRSQFAQSQSNAGKEAEQRAYERFISDRNWNQDRYNQEIDNRMKAGQQQAQGLQGFNGLQATTNPEVQRAVVDVISSEPNLDLRNPNQVMIALRKKYPHINPDEAFSYITQYNNLGSTNKFPVG
jgi:hypothetical protein